MARFDLKTLFQMPTAQERVAGLNLRPDLAAAVILLVADQRTDAEVVRLQPCLTDTESVVLIVEGRAVRRLGLLVLTTQRVLFRAHGVTDDDVVTLPLDQISGSEAQVLHMTGLVRLRTADLVLQVDKILGTLADQFVTAVRAQQSAPEPVEGVDPVQELIDLRARHAAGAVTDDDYEAAKIRLLKQL